MKKNLKVIFALTLVHFTGDFYSAFTTPLFPAFMDKLNLTLAQELAPGGRSMVSSLMMGLGLWPGWHNGATDWQAGGYLFG